jgi:uroporphyrinogen decarboxylase
MDFIVNATIDYLDLQIEAGVNAIQLFDSWGDAMATDVYQEYILPYIEKITLSVSKKVPVIYFCRGASIHREALTGLYDKGVSSLSIDWRMPIDFYKDKPVQGNLDPAVLLSDPQTVAKMTSDILNRRGNRTGFTFNLGHGIYPETPMENVESMVATVKNFKPDYLA